MTAKVVLACDICDELADSFDIALDAKPVRIELCPEHLSEFVTPLKDVLAKYGRKPSAKIPFVEGTKSKKASAVLAADAADSTSFKCHVCPREFMKPNGLSRHFRFGHPAEYAAEQLGIAS